MVSYILPSIGCNILPLARLEFRLTVLASDNLYVFVLNHCPTESPSFVVHILFLHHSAPLQVQLPAGIMIITTIIPSSYEVNSAVLCHGSKMPIWKVGDVLNGLIFLCVVVALHAFHIDVFERLSVGLKRIGYYALRLVFNRVFSINLLVLEFSYDFCQIRFDFFLRVLMTVFHLSCFKLA